MMLRIVLILLFVVFGESQNMRDDSGDCEIPGVNGGSVQKEVIGDWYWSWGKYRYERDASYEIVRKGSFVTPSTVLWLYCEKPYSVDGRGKERESIKCSKGRWSMDLICLRGRCYFSDLKNLQNVSPETPSITFSGDRLNVVCEDGYSPKSTPPICENGGWNSDYTSLCEESDCEIPRVNGGSVQKEVIGERYWSWEKFRYDEREASYEIVSKGSSITPGTVLLLYCEKPYSVHGSGKEREAIKCSKGKWSMDLICLRDDDLRCPEFPEDGGIIVQYEMERHERSKVYFTCPKKGQELIGKPELTCLSSKEWSDRPPYCTDYVSCSIFPHSPGLVVSYSEGVSVGSNASFTCSPPNILVGSSYAICQNNGSWNHPLSKCEETSCPMFSTVNGLSVRYDNSNRRGSWATFSCPVNTKLVGTTVSRCQNDGTWSRPEPQCKDLLGVPGCHLKLDPSSQLVIQPIKDSYHLGESVFLSCPPGKEMSGDVERVMCLGTTWSESIPNCKG